MSDITELFNSVAPDGGAPSPQTVEADLSRGHLALARAHRQRTIRRSMLAGGSLVVAAGVVVAGVQLSGSSTPKSNIATKTPTVSQQHPGAKQHQHPSVKPSIKLVAYNGKQLEGFNVDQVPAGWQLSTSTQYALLITKDGSTDNDPNAFEGKLAVLTSSVDEHGLGKGDDVTVNGQPGVVSDQGKYGLMLRYNAANGFGIDIQAPAELNWTDDQIVAFAEGVHVTGNAVHSRG
jgi:hypothetical protein